VTAPLLLVDVDGVVSLFGFDPNRPPDGRFQLVEGIAHLISATAGEHLRRLSARFELVWCTGWEEKANEYLVAALELSAPLPYLRFDHEVRLVRAHWKLAAIERFAGPDRALAWIDDAHSPECREWAAARRGRTLLMTTDPWTGLTEEHVGELMDWAGSKGNSSGRA
jgi:hypothetical protein